MEGTEKPPFPRERRRHKRFELSLALAYQWGMTKGTLRTIDLSLGGRVVRSNQSSIRKFDVGICFETISQQCFKRLDRFLHRITQKGDAAKREKPLDESGLTGLESKSFELDRLKGNFLRWLNKSYPGDYQRYAHRPVIGENEVWDFLKSKGIDKVNIYYLVQSLKGG